MATKDDILKRKGLDNPPKGAAMWQEQSGEASAPDNAPKGSQEWAEQNSGDNAQTQPVLRPAPQTQKPTGGNPQEVVTPIAEQHQAKATTDSGKKGLSYVEMFKQMTPYKPPTEEEIEKEKKKQRRESIFSAIGDGISALANLHFAGNYGLNTYDPSNSMSAKTKERWDRLKKDREENASKYAAAYMRAQKADNDAEQADRNWRRTLERDAIADQRYAEGVQRQEEQERKANERWKETQEYKKERDKVSDEQWNKQQEESKRRFDVQQKAAEERTKAIVASNKYKSAQSARGKRLGFVDGTGNEVGIYENVWKGSMPQVFEAIVKDGVPTPALSQVEQMSASDMETFVKQNWTKSQNASQIMLVLSKIDPGEMIDQINAEDDEDFSQYIDNGNEDFEQYKEN